MSRVGNKPIPVPPKVTVKIGGGKVTVEGPKGTLDRALPDGVSIEERDGQLVVSRASELRHHRAMHGTIRSLVASMLTGVSEGFTKNLEIIGVGFRATVKGQDLDLQLGRSHPLLHPIPSDITVTVTDNTKLRVEGIDKQKVGQFAAEVRSFHPPEPYKGKGVRYAGEHVRRKEGKTVGS